MTVICDLHGEKKRELRNLGEQELTVLGAQLYMEKIRKESQITPRFLDWENR